MDNMNLSAQKQAAPYIKRTIDGREYTVIVHFSESAKETPKQKINRILRSIVESEKTKT